MSPFSRSRLVVGSAALVVVFAHAVLAQQPPLAEVARREAERRKATQPATKVLTNKDLPKVTHPAAAPAPAADPAATAADPAATPASQATDAAATGPDAPAPGPQRTEAWWRARIGAAREAMSRSEVLADALQSRVNALSSDFVARDDPFQRAKIGEDRQKALAELARMQDEIATLKTSIADIEEEARKSSVPPGWLR